MNVKPKCSFNFLRLNEKLSFCLICLFTNNTGNTINVRFYGFCTQWLCRETNVSKTVFLLATSLKNDDLFVQTINLMLQK